MGSRLRLWLNIPDETVRRPLSNLRLLLSRFALVGKEHSPCSECSRATSIAAQQNR